MQYRVLGSLEVRDGDRSIPLGGTKQRALLALLLLNGNRVVSRERLIDGLWGDEPPETAVQSVQVYVSRLRKLVPKGALVTKAPGYLLQVEPDDVDLHRFERLLADARKAGPERASIALREALDLWRDPALAEFAGEPFALAETGRLEDLRLAALEERIDADLALGRHTDLVGELETLVDANPLRERLCGQLILALYRSGRQAEALEAYRRSRAALDELGIEPSEQLRQLEKQILTQDAALETRPLPLHERISLPGPLAVSSPFPFVGRSNEVTVLRELLALAAEEGGRVALIGGEPGSGKTRLVRELAREASADETLVVYGASGAIVNSPYRPFVELLEFLLEVTEADSLRECLGTWGGELTRILPDLELRVGQLPEPMRADPQTERRRLHMAVTAFLANVSRLRPLVVVLDDLHWADTPSLHLFRHLARAAPEARVLLIATYRGRSEDAQPEFADALSDLFRIDGVMHFALEPLTSADVAEFIRLSAGAENTAEPSFADAVVKLTDGNPFLLCEIWRALVDTGVVEFADGSLRLTQPIGELASPERVREVVRFRLSRLAPATIEMLEIAAVAGTQFDLRVLGEAAALKDSVEESVRSGMLEEVPGPGLVHRFTHELLRRAVYDRLTSVRRAELHLRVGEELERAHAANPARVLEELAYHFTIAAPLAGPQRAVEYNVRAAEAATESLAFEEAATRLSAALELVDHDPLFAEVALNLGFALRHSGNHKRAAAVLQDAVDAAGAAGDRRLVALATVELAFVSADIDGSVTASTERSVRNAIEVFNESADDLGLSKTWHLLGELDWLACRFGAAEEHYARALSHAERADDRRQRSSLMLGLAVAALLGPTPVDAAIRRCESMLADVQADRILEAGATAVLGVLNAMAGRFAEAQKSSALSISTFTELGLELRLVGAREYAASSALLAGDLDAAEHELRLAYESLTRLELRPQSAGIAAMLAEILCRRGRFEEAGLFVEQARAASGTDVLAQATWRRAAAKLAAADGDFDTAIQTLREAAAIVAKTDALNHQGDVHVDLGDVLLASGGDERAARAELEIALALYRRKENAVSVARTEAALTEVKSRSRFARKPM